MVDTSIFYYERNEINLHLYAWTSYEHFISTIFSVHLIFYLQPYIDETVTAM